MVLYDSYSCPLGTLIIGSDEGQVVSVKLTPAAEHPRFPTAPSDQAAAQLLAYFDGTRKDFDFPVSATGTPFQRAVWDALRQIPYGETRTYSQIAAMIGKPKAVRAVGMACNRNPLWIVIPCHRVIGKNGALTGFEGGLDTKKALLELEQRNT